MTKQYKYNLINSVLISFSFCEVDFWNYKHFCCQSNGHIHTKKSNFLHNKNTVQTKYINYGGIKFFRSTPCLQQLVCCNCIEFIQIANMIFYFSLTISNLTLPPAVAGLSLYAIMVYLSSFPLSSLTGMIVYVTSPIERLDL